MKATELLSIYAALLSTAVFIWNIVRAIPRYKVNIVYAVHEEDGEYKHGVYVLIRNPSPHTIHLARVDILYLYEEVSFIERVGFMFRYRRFPNTVGWVVHSSLSEFGLKNEFPLTLESGKSKNVFVPHEVLEDIFEGCVGRDIKVCVQDQLWRNKYSPKFNYSKE